MVTEATASDKYLFFLDGIYSQWYEAPMTIDGVTYVCCEQYMMHQKALAFGDTEIAEKIMGTVAPYEHKILGRQIRGFDPDKWTKMAFGVVYKGNLNKFTQNKDLQEKMLATHDLIFVEASPFDRIWGIGMGELDKGIDDPINWNGQNLLGWALTLVKHEIRRKDW